MYEKNSYIVILLVFIILLPSRLAFSQSFHFNIAKYSNEDGVPSNLVKAVEKDSNNFIWFASGAGITQYNGISFKTYTKGFPSLYVKGLIIDDRGRVVVANDLGVGYLKKVDEGYQYVNMVEGTTTASEDHLYYPKNIMQDSKGRYWISDVNSISLYIEDTFQKYSISGDYIVDNFTDSFKIIEAPKGRIIALSLTGHAFMYDYRGNEFRKLTSSINGAITDINSTGEKLLFSTNTGIYEAEVNFEKFRANVEKVIDNIIFGILSSTSIKIIIYTLPKIKYYTLTEQKG